MEIDDHRIDKDDLENTEIAVDSTRVSIYNNNGGHSKLNIRERKYNGYDQVRKLHIVLNVNDKKAINMKYTHGVAADYLSACRGNKYKVRSVRADAAYDIRRVYKECGKYNLLFGLAKICLADYLSENILVKLDHMRIMRMV